MQTLDLIQLLLTVAIFIWGVFQFFATKRLEEQLHRLTVGLDQSIQLLHRARDAAIGMHRTHLYMLTRHQHLTEIDEKQATAQAEHSAYWAELRGLAFAIDDKELLDLVNSGYDWITAQDGNRTLGTDEMTLRGKFQHIHTRIAHLLVIKSEQYGRN